MSKWSLTPGGAGFAESGCVLRCLVLVLLCASGCIIPYATPPIRAEIGAVSSVRRHETGLHVAGGAHLASGTISHAQKIDIGVGGFGDWSETGPTQKGGYVDGAMFIDHGENTRTSVGVRGELRWANGMGSGAKVRIDHEMYGTGTKSFTGDDHCGATSGTWRGTTAIGVFAEAGHVWMPDDASAWTATAGLTLRIPGSAGVYIGIPGCK